MNRQTNNTFSYPTTVAETMRLMKIEKPRIFQKMINSINFSLKATKGVTYLQVLKSIFTYLQVLQIPSLLKHFFVLRSQTVEKYLTEVVIVSRVMS